MEKKKIKCVRCGYEWYSKSKLVFISCPSCLYKNKVNEINQEKIERGSDKE